MGFGLSDLSKKVVKKSPGGKAVARASGRGFGRGLAAKLTSKIAGAATKASSGGGALGLGKKSVASTVASRVAGSVKRPKMMTNPAAGKGEHIAGGGFRRAGTPPMVAGAGSTKGRSYGDDVYVNGKPRTPEMLAAGAKATAVAKASEARQYGASGPMRKFKSTKAIGG